MLGHAAHNPGHCGLHACAAAVLVVCAKGCSTNNLQGFFYNRYPVAETTGAGDLGTETAINENVMLVYHRVGTPQSEDVVVLAGGLGLCVGAACCCPCKVSATDLAAVAGLCLLLVAHLLAL